MLKISYQEIVTPDICESGLVLHDWEYNKSTIIKSLSSLSHFINGVYDDTLYNQDANLKWEQLCQSK